METQVDRIFCAKADRDLYETFKNQSPFLKNRDNKDLFLFAFTYGVKHNCREALPDKFGFIRLEYLNDYDWAILKIVILSILPPIENVNDKKIIIEMAQEYAHGGIKYIIDVIKKNKGIEFDTYFENELLNSLS